MLFLLIFAALAHASGYILYDKHNETGPYDFLIWEFYVLQSYLSDNDSE